MKKSPSGILDCCQIELEDDVIVAPDWPIRLEDCICQFLGDFDVVVLGWNVDSLLLRSHFQVSM